MLSDVEVVDLSAPLGPGSVLWPGERPLEAVTTTDPADGSSSRRVSLPEHAGTHLDAPLHYVPDGADVSAIPATRLVAPVVVLDLAAQWQGRPDSLLGVDDVLEHEAGHGPIAPGSAVFLRTGWDARRDDALVYRGGDTEASLHFPGFSVAAARLLVDRGAVGLGIDTLGIDGGAAAGAPVHRRVTLPAGVWHLENLVALDRVPAVGAWVVVGVPRIEGATGFPARVLALVPRADRS